MPGGMAGRGEDSRLLAASDSFTHYNKFVSLNKEKLRKVHNSKKNLIISCSFPEVCYIVFIYLMGPLLVCALEGQIVGARGKMMDYRTVYQGGSAEVVEKKSRFIADVFPVQSEEMAAEYLEKIKKQYWDARHHCWAYIIGKDPAKERYSDDGEPGGTAGKPILEVIKGRELCNVLIIVTRYFGGTLLGTGGLVRAYTSAARAGLEHSTIITRMHGFKLKIGTDYTGLGKIQYILGRRQIHILKTGYTDAVEMTVLVRESEVNAVIAEITEGTSGKSSVRKGEGCWFADIDGQCHIFDS